MVGGVSFYLLNSFKIGDTITRAVGLAAHSSVRMDRPWSSNGQRSIDEFDCYAIVEQVQL